MDKKTLDSLKMRKINALGLNRQFGNTFAKTASHTKERNDRHSEKMRGNTYASAVRHDEEWKEKHSERMKGPNNPRWKGGVGRSYRDGYYSKEYREWREEVFKRDGYACQNCFVQGNRGAYLTAHHVKSFAQHPELRFDVSNGQTLCDHCHSLTDNYKGRANRVISKGTF